MQRDADTDGDAHWGESSIPRIGCALGVGFLSGVKAGFGGGAWVAGFAEADEGWGGVGVGVGVRWVVDPGVGMLDGVLEDALCVVLAVGAAVGGVVVGLVEGLEGTGGEADVGVCGGSVGERTSVAFVVDG